jgi:hypothetical protein
LPKTDAYSFGFIGWDEDWIYFEKNSGNSYRISKDLSKEEQLSFFDYKQIADITDGEDWAADGISYSQEAEWVADGYFSTIHNGDIYISPTNDIGNFRKVSLEPMLSVNGDSGEV